MNQKSLLKPALLLVALLFSAALQAAPPPPRTFTVTSTADSGDSNLIDQTCDDGTGHCTLRAAIANANNFGAFDTIQFNIPTTDPGYNAQTGIYTITLFSALPDLSTGMNINGPGADKLTVTRSDNLRRVIVRIFNVTTAGTINFSGITMANGNAPAGESGGGIQNVNGGTVNLTNCVLRGNLSDRGGGGIFNASSGTVNVTNSALLFNRAVVSGAFAAGGGIYNKTGTINATNTTFYHNISTDLGGGIYNETGVVTVTGSTFRENCARRNGGGIANERGPMSVSNSTFYANSASGNDGVHGVGGGIYNGGALNLTNSTLAANFSGVAGGGISVASTFGGMTNVKSTIIALNYGGSSLFGESPDVYGAFSSQGFNLIGKREGSTGFTAATDKKGTIAAPLNPKLDIRGLWNNGGPTLTISLQPGSPAIDKGTSVGLTGTLTTDQRGTGFPRTVDKAVANAAGGDGTDIGAFEVQ